MLTNPKRNSISWKCIFVHCEVYIFIPEINPQVIGSKTGFEPATTHFPNSRFIRWATLAFISWIYWEDPDQLSLSSNHPHIATHSPSHFLTTNDISAKIKSIFGCFLTGLNPDLRYRRSAASYKPNPVYLLSATGFYFIKLGECTVWDLYMCVGLCAYLHVCTYTYRYARM